MPLRLHFYKRELECGVTLASEPLDGKASDWMGSARELLCYNFTRKHTAQKSHSRHSWKGSWNMFEQFKKDLEQSNLVEQLRSEIIGDGISIPGPYGEKPLVYADYVASARALRRIERFVSEDILPYYANSHTRSSYCGAYMTQMREEARQKIARSIGADDNYSVVFTGAGATAAINRLVRLLGIEDAVRSGVQPVIFIGPYEHHSNILPWRETGAEVVIIPEAINGGPDLTILEQKLHEFADRALKVGSFSAASNVTGITTDVAAVARVLKANGALSVWDYAGGAPYLPVYARIEDVDIGCVVFVCPQVPRWALLPRVFSLSKTNSARPRVQAGPAAER